MEHASPEVRDQVYCFNTYFYASLTNGASGKKGINYDAVKRWTSKLAKDDLFQYNYIVVPINQSSVTLDSYDMLCSFELIHSPRYHWYAAVICNVHNLQHSFLEEDESRPASRDTFLKQLDSVDGQNAPFATVADQTNLERKYRSLRISDDKDSTYRRKTRSLPDESNPVDRQDIVDLAVDERPTQAARGKRPKDPTE